MAFLEDPRLRQRWNQITHDAETVTENAAAGIWTFQHQYINPCLGSLRGAIEQCTTVCLGDPEERLRRQRERARERTEYSFNFYDDWDREEESGGLLGNWGGEDWDRLLAGSGSQRRGETVEQPRRKRGMSYGTRGARRKNSEQDPTIIPSTQPIGFLSKLPWKMGGTLRYKPSAADLQEHPGTRKHEYTESQPLLGAEDDSDHERLLQPSRSRKRSGTTGSGGTSDSYRSRGDLFPSDGEGDEDAVALDDDVTYDMIRRDDRSSAMSGRTPSSKGKRPAHTVSRTVSRTTLGSVASKDSLGLAIFGQVTQDPTQDAQPLPSLKDLELEEERLGREEDQELAKKKEAAAQLALDRGLQTEAEPKPADVADDEYLTEEPHEIHLDDDEDSDDEAHHDSGLSGGDLEIRAKDRASPPVQSAFVPARLPHFG
ncbi:hypothetical protein N5P37_008386 [Trichoderma harzianum]|uniref:Uncharacterized protein n=1 Tax=Trichoderma harzianum CBS 226.95 TaxID=983964 RepID=A0A2T4AMD3_TRIHA|nr:hypothetical protein M431DRAFT_505776 [Trichoderma harzianum CBS 226.95]KAK0758900.1 hypothetical protein N5P37_008386 [Trichoderma harzianum]PTB58236.1 hypothetical protein M431DRAFT_505776 [Trichoderma harzianum CBS 226.95]